jgi:membrane protease YdiL (CAAX protease family)
MDPVTAERARMMAPRSRQDLATFYLVAASAGFSEQLAYRGALFAILSVIAGNWWIAAAIGAAAFGLAHLFQGWRAAGVVALIALRDQIVVGLTGTLVIAMIAHALHDMIAATLLRTRVRREEHGPKGPGGSALAVS